MLTGNQAHWFSQFFFTFNKKEKEIDKGKKSQGLIPLIDFF